MNCHYLNASRTSLLFCLNDSKAPSIPIKDTEIENTDTEKKDTEKRLSICRANENRNQNKILFYCLKKSNFSNQEKKKLKPLNIMDFVASSSSSSVVVVVVDFIAQSFKLRKQITSLL